MPKETHFGEPALFNGDQEESIYHSSPACQCCYMEWGCGPSKQREWGICITTASGPSWVSPDTSSGGSISHQASWEHFLVWRRQDVLHHLRCLRHLAHIKSHRIPKQLLFGELQKRRPMYVGDDLCTKCIILVVSFCHTAAGRPLFPLLYSSPSLMHTHANHLQKKLIIWLFYNTVYVYCIAMLAFLVLPRCKRIHVQTAEV